MTRIATLVIATALLVGAGCGGAHQGADAGAAACADGVEPIESFEHDLITARCAFQVRIHENATVDGCVAATRGLVSPQLLQDVRSGVVRYDPRVGFCCLQTVRDTRCLSLDYLACHDAFTGTLAAGAACALDIECVSGACMRTSCGADCCPGTCASGVEDRSTPVGAGEGQSCGQQRCMAGLYCKGANPICIRPASRGGACAENSCDCTSFCDDATKTCRAPPAIGDPCTGIAECGLALDCVNGQCAAPGAIGDPCDGGAAVPCQGGAGLEGSVACMNGVCTSTATGASLACASP